MIELLNCPHCNGKARFKESSSRSVNFDYIYVECSDCEASTRHYHDKTFIQMSQYTVQDFRENNSLRPEAEEIHRKYKEQLKVEIAAAWNKRIEL